MNDEINKLAQQTIADMEHKFLFGNATTCTSKEPESLTVDILTKTMQEIRGMLPVVWYRFCKWLPDEIKGKPCNALAFEFGEDKVLFIHPDRFEQVKRGFGPCNFVEYPQERMEQQTMAQALADLNRVSRAAMARKLQKRMVWDI